MADELAFMKHGGMITSVLVAGAAGAIIFTLLGSVFSSVSAQIFPSNPTFAAAGTGFAIGAGIQLTVRLLGVS
jgi:hypothetical protein